MLEFQLEYEFLDNILSFLYDKCSFVYTTRRGIRGTRPLTTQMLTVVCYSSLANTASDAFCMGQPISMF